MKSVLTYTILAFQLNGALGNSECNDITIAEVKKHIENRTIFHFLKLKLKNIDISILSNDVQKELMDQWDDMSNSIEEGRKLCVVQNGICLLVAYLLEGIQRFLSEIK